jgi:hypothetical protein
MTHRPDTGGRTYLWNVGRQLFFTAVHPRKQIWAVFFYVFQCSFPLHISPMVNYPKNMCQNKIKICDCFLLLAYSQCSVSSFKRRMKLSMFVFWAATQCETCLVTNRTGSVHNVSNILQAYTRGHKPVHNLNTSFHKFICMWVKKNSEMNAFFNEREVEWLTFLLCIR